VLVTPAHAVMLVKHSNIESVRNIEPEK
jgi:hypothetical protein